MKKNIVYIVSIEDIWRAPTVKSQVINLLKYVSKKKYKINLISIYPIINYFRFRKNLNKLSKNLKKYNVHLHVMPVFFLGRFFVMKWFTLIFLYFPQALFITILLKIKFGKAIYHCRSYPASIIGLCSNLLFNNKFIFDMRGLYPEEAIIHKKFTLSSLSLKAWKYIEKKLVKKAKITITVSKPFKKIIKNNYSLNNITIIPNFSQVPSFTLLNNWRKEYRNKMGIKEKVVAIYAGGQGSIHKSEDIIKVYKRLKAVSSIKWFFLLFITGNTSQIKKEFEKNFKTKKWRILSLDQANVIKYLSIGDFGIISTQNNPISKTWMPIKFAEYLASGLSIISSNNLGQVTKMVKKYKLGIIYNNLSDQNFKNKIKYFIKNRNKKRKLSWNIATKKLSLEKNSKKYLEIYDELNFQ